MFKTSILLITVSILYWPIVALAGQPALGLYCTDKPLKNGGVSVHCLTIPPIDYDKLSNNINKEIRIEPVLDCSTATVCNLLKKTLHSEHDR